MTHTKIIYSLILISLFTASSVCAGGSSIQAFGSWWEAGDTDSSYGGGLRATMGDDLAIDAAWTFIVGDEFTLDNGQETDIDGLDSHIFDLGLRYTFPAEIYVGGGGSYFFLDSDEGSTDGEFGLYGLVGWSFGKRNLRFFVEGVYRYTEATIELDGMTTNYDVSYDGFGANAGIMYRF